MIDLEFGTRDGRVLDQDPCCCHWIASLLTDATVAMGWLNVEQLAVDLKIWRAKLCYSGFKFVKYKKIQSVLTTLLISKTFKTRKPIIFYRVTMAPRSWLQWNKSALLNWEISRNNWLQFDLEQKLVFFRFLSTKHCNGLSSLVVF